jgi:hypothetical protein
MSCCSGITVVDGWELTKLKREVSRWRVKRMKRRERRESNGSYRGGRYHAEANVRVKRSFYLGEG